MTPRLLRLASVFLLLVAAACSSEKKLGETCEESGKTDGECESGGVCGKNTSASLQCLKICTEQSQCAEAEECNGVEGSSAKGCRLKSDTTTDPKKQ